MRRYLTFMLLLIAAFACGMCARALQQQSPILQGGKKAVSANPPAGSETGEQVFQTNCARCHTPPMTLPQHVTGTIIMHMRVRARLSRHDEQLLLKYMAP